MLYSIVNAIAKACVAASFRAASRNSGNTMSTTVADRSSASFGEVVAVAVAVAAAQGGGSKAAG